MRITLLLASLLVSVPWVVSAEPISIAVESTSVSQAWGTQTGMLEVFAHVDGEGPQIVGYSIRLQLAEPGCGFRFTEVTAPMGRPYLFPQSSPVGTISGDFDDIADGVDLLLSGSEPLVDGVGLMRVGYEVAGGTTGVFHVQIVPDQTELTDVNLNSLPYALEGGIVTVVPEPSSLTLTLLLGGALPFLPLLRRWWRGWF
jgi:hypothetical protein